MIVRELLGRAAEAQAMEPTIQHDPVELDLPPSLYGSAMLVIVFFASALGSGR